MIEFILGGILGAMLAGGGRNTPHLEKYFTIKTVGDSKELLKSLIEKYDSEVIFEKEGLWNSIPIKGKVLIQKDEDGLFYGCHTYEEKRILLTYFNEIKTDCTLYIRSANIGKFAYIQIKIVSEHGVTFSDLQLLKLLECIETGASEKFVKWKKKLEINGVEFNKKNKEADKK